MTRRRVSLSVCAVRVSPSRPSRRTTALTLSVTPFEMKRGGAFAASDIAIDFMVRPNRPAMLSAWFGKIVQRAIFLLTCVDPTHPPE